MGYTIKSMRELNIPVFCVMRVAVPIPAVASASVFHSAAGGGSVVDVVRPL